MVQPDELVSRLAAADRRPPYRLLYTALHLQLNVTKITMLKVQELWYKRQGVTETSLSR